jgi:hypothetical protein
MFGGGASAEQAASRLGLLAGSNAGAAAFGDLFALAVPFAAIDEPSRQPARSRGRCSGRA